MDPNNTLYELFAKLEKDLSLVSTFYIKKEKPKEKKPKMVQRVDN
jgi:hypothetical protein